MMVAKIVGGVTFGSIPLIAYGLHMSAHAGGLPLAALAYTYARRHADDPRFSFGTGKPEDLAGFTSAAIHHGADAHEHAAHGDGAITPAISVLSALEGMHLWYRASTRTCFRRRFRPARAVRRTAARDRASSAGSSDRSMLSWFAVITLMGIRGRRRANASVATGEREGPSVMADQGGQPASKRSDPSQRSSVSHRRSKRAVRSVVADRHAIATTRTEEGVAGMTSD